MSQQGETSGQKAELLDRILQRAGSDPAFRNHLIHNPGEALQEAGFAAEIRNLSREDDVSGYGVQASLGDPLMGKALVDPVHNLQGGLAGSLILGVESLFNWVTAMVAEATPVDSTGDPPAIAYMPGGRTAE